MERRNAEGYHDPTAYGGMRMAEQKAEKEMVKMVYKNGRMELYIHEFFPCTAAWQGIPAVLHPASVLFPSSSKMRRLHLGLGHLISSICHRLLYSTPASNRPYFPPPVLICNKGTSLPLPIPLYHLCFIGFLPAPDSPICRKAGDACPALSGCSLLGICNG